jgi:hypothetical protein
MNSSLIFLIDSERVQVPRPIRWRFKLEISHIL